MIRRCYAFQFGEEVSHDLNHGRIVDGFRAARIVRGLSRSGTIPENEGLV